MAGGAGRWRWWGWMFKPAQGGNYILSAKYESWRPRQHIDATLGTFPDIPQLCIRTRRHPVHVVCVFGVSSEFVSHVINMEPSSATTKDIDGKTPIHLLCQGTWKLEVGRISGMSIITLQLRRTWEDIIWILNQTAPSTLASEDIYGA